MKIKLTMQQIGNTVIGQQLECSGFTSRSTDYLDVWVHSKPAFTVKGIMLTPDTPNAHDETMTLRFDDVFSAQAYVTKVKRTMRALADASTKLEQETWYSNNGYRIMQVGRELISICYGAAFGKCVKGIYLSGHQWLKFDQASKVQHRGCQIHEFSTERHAEHCLMVFLDKSEDTYTDALENGWNILTVTG